MTKTKGMHSTKWLLFFSLVEIKNDPIECELRKRLAINQSYYNIRFEFDVSIRKKFCTIFHTYNDRQNEGSREKNRSKYGAENYLIEIWKK